jgi:hypothetical protein
LLGRAEDTRRYKTPSAAGKQVDNKRVIATPCRRYIRRITKIITQLNKAAKQLIIAVDRKGTATIKEKKRVTILEVFQCLLFLVINDKESQLWIFTIKVALVEYDEMSTERRGILSANANISSPRRLA